METLIIVIFFIIILVCAGVVFYATIYNKFQDYIIRINEVESKIDRNLRTKFDLLTRVVPIIKGTISDSQKDKNKEIFPDIVKLRSRKISNFELYRILTKTEVELNGLKEEYPDIQKSEEIKKIIKQIKDIDINIENSIEYYNDNVNLYNLLLKKFPSNIIAIISKYKEKLFFDRKNMNDEDYNDFKL